jgi:hypothetical protein
VNESASCDGREMPVAVIGQSRKRSFSPRGTEGSNPAPSSGESVSAVNHGAVGEKPRSLAAVYVWVGT